MIAPEIFEALKREQVILGDLRGQGTYGSVFACRYDGGLPGAIKISHTPLDDGKLSAASKEFGRLMMLAELPRVPNLIHLKRVLQPCNHLATIWDLGEQDLEDRLAEHKGRGCTGIPRDELIRHVRAVGGALDFLHSRGFHHRDVKPRNLLLIAGSAHLADLGHTAYAGLSTGSQSIAGTPGYMAPEIAAGRDPSPASDLYSLAVTYLVLRTGQEPRGSIPKLLQQLDPAERPAVKAATADDPSRRPQGVRNWVDRLEREVCRRPLHVCPTCESGFATDRGLAQHRRDKHSARFPCSIGACAERFATLDELETHVVEVHHWGLCRICGVAFLSPERLKEHRAQCRPPTKGQRTRGVGRGQTPREQRDPRVSTEDET
jgi:hypothetical protein